MHFTHSQHVCVYIRRIHQTGDWLNKDKESDDHQEQAIDESRKYFNTAIPAKKQNKNNSVNTQLHSSFKLLQQQYILTCWQTLPVGEDPGSFPAGHEGSKQAQD